MVQYTYYLEEDFRIAKQHDKQFKIDAIQYYEDHKELGLRGCANNLGIGYSTLTKWRKELRDSGDIVVRGSGNYESDEQKEIARLRRNLDLSLIIHSDRGCQYVAKEYKKATALMQRSYSKKAYPWDNACIESFHALIKREWLNRFRIRDFNHAYSLIFEYIEAFYNTKRIHSHCGYLSPDEFEKLYKASAAREALLIS